MPLLTSYAQSLTMATWIAETCSYLDLWKYVLCLKDSKLLFIWVIHIALHKSQQSFSAKKQNYDVETDKGQVYGMLQRQHTKKCHLFCLATCNYSVRSEWKFWWMMCDDTALKCTAVSKDSYHTGKCEWVFCYILLVLFDDIRLCMHCKWQTEQCVITELL